MMPILDEEKFPYLDQIYWRQCLALAVRPGYPQPASPIVIPERVEVAIKVAGPVLTTLDVTDGHALYPQVALTVCDAGGVDLIQGEQAMGAPGQG
jgi:hypothetical protein